NVPLRFQTLVAGFPLKPYPSPEQTAKALSDAEQRLSEIPTNGASPEYRQAKSEVLYSSITHFYARQATRYKDGVLPMELQAIQIGDSVFVGVPAEVFVEVGMRLKKSGDMR